MTKRALSMALVFMMILSLSVQATQTRAIRATPQITFSGTTATCMADCKSSDTNDKIAATLTLYQGNTYVTSWSDSGNGRVLISKTRTVSSGQSYRLVLTYSVNGVSQPSVSVTNTCP